VTQKPGRRPVPEQGTPARGLRRHTLPKEDGARQTKEEGTIPFQLGKGTNPPRDGGGGNLATKIRFT